MKCVDRKHHPVDGGQGQDAFLKKLYDSKWGRWLLKGLVRPWVSKVGGWVLSRRISTVAIPGFIQKNQIDMLQYEECRFRSYNDFFTRKIKPGSRVMDLTPAHLIAPCDSRLSVYPISLDATFLVKEMPYTVGQLLKNEALAKEYEGGTLLLFRLTVADYHRYCYVDNGRISKATWIPGVFHTVNPAAGEVYPIYKENTRCYSILDSEQFGEILVMEVGALLVGKIVNHLEEGLVSKGEEKGHFEFGGSTVILLLKKNVCQMDADLVENTRRGLETQVRYGEKIGVKMG